MITANELRIGNLFKTKDNGTVLSVRGVAESEHGNIVWYDKEGGFYLNIDEILPIELTPAILQKAGCLYDKWNKVWEIAHEFYWAEEEITEPGGGKIISVEHNVYYQAITSSCSMLSRYEIIYMHQLQNLYFGIYGKDLEIPL